jgi:hypothetical protein
MAIDMMKTLSLFLFGIIFGVAQAQVPLAPTDTSGSDVPVLFLSVGERATRNGRFVNLSFEIWARDGKGDPGRGIPVTLAVKRDKRKGPDPLFSMVTDSLGRAEGIAGVPLKMGQRAFELTASCKPLRVESSLSLKAMGSGRDVWVVPQDQKGPSAWYLFMGRDPRQEERQKTILAALPKAPRSWRSKKEMLRQLNEFTASYARMSPDEVREAAREVIASSGGEFDFLTPDMIEALVEVESRGNPYDIGTRGEIGLGQILPETAERFAGLSTVPSRQLVTLLLRHKITLEKFYNEVFSDERSDGYKNLFASLSYLRHLNTLFRGNKLAALAAYNCGEGRVLRAYSSRGKLIPGRLPRYTRNQYLPRFISHEKAIAEAKSQSTED